MIQEKTTKEEWTNKYYANDNNRLHFADVAFEYLPPLPLNPEAFISLTIPSGPWKVMQEAL